jgi:DNA-directed RNA polymerase specialized sigma24 family protein
VTNLNLEHHMTAARGMARTKANMVIGQGGLTREDRDDIEAQLLLTLCRRARKFDSGRSSIGTFTSQVMDREVASILRYRLAGRRLHLGRPALVDGGALNDLSVTSPFTVEQQEFWLDVDKVVKTLPATLRETVFALRCGSPTEASQALGTAKSVVYERIAQIRQAFLAAGIGPTYFPPRGAL